MSSVKDNRFSLKDNILSINCNDKTVTIENYNFDNKIIFSRKKHKKDGEWLFCYTWNQVSGKNAGHNLIFVNLLTGEKHVTQCPYLERGIFTFSPNGNFLSINCYISVAGCENFTLVDITNISAINVIFREEGGYSGNYSFNENSDLVSKHEFEFFEYKGKVVFEDDLDEIKVMFNANSTLVSDLDLWRGGVKNHNVNITIIRRVNPNKITPPRYSKWQEIPCPTKEFYELVNKYVLEGLKTYQASNKANSVPRQELIDHYNKYDTKHRTTCTVNEMDEIVIIKSDEYDRLVTNVNNPFGYWYLK
jgi:hypothetical protein